MTQRLYYNDSYTVNFTAKLLEKTTYQGRAAAVLDATYFYPSGGGQPYDLGKLNDIPVLEVLTRPEDEAVLHILEQPLAGETITAQVDWSRRFDHMQQHTGQHILSRAFEELMNAQTVGFHLTETNLTIDLNIPDLSVQAAEEAEALANQIVMENRPVRAWFPSAQELAELKLRKLSEKVSGAVRVVEVQGFDVCACGGTHVAHTGEIGMIKIIKWERSKGSVRLEFRCGRRALDDYRQKNALLLGLASDLTLSWQDIPAAVDRLREENKTLNKALRDAQNRLIQYEADDLWTQAQAANPERIIVAGVWENRPASDLQGLAQHLARRPKTIALLGLAGEKAHLVFACSEDAGVDVVPFLKAALAKFGAQGGGRPVLAQGGGFAASQDQLANAIAEVRQQLAG